MDLVNTGTDPWILEHEACEILNREILEQLNIRSNQNYLSKEYDLLSARIRNRLKQFSTQVDQLDKKLKSANLISSITREEHERRKRQVEILQSNIMKLQDEFIRRKASDRPATSRNEDRSRLLGQKKESMFADMGTASWGDVGSNDTPPVYDIQASASKTIDELKADQQMMLREQDEGLESLSKIISRQKEIAKTINVEVDQQNELLDDISHDMGRIEGRIQRETNMITVISRKDRTWGYWVIIVILFVVIIGVSVA